MKPMVELIVQKYGGTSIDSIAAIRLIACQIVETTRENTSLIIVVSAMDQTTDDLLSLARKAASDPDRRELDALLSTGEIVSAALLAMAIRALGVEAISLTGSQAGILTNGVHSNARILEIQTGRLRRELERGRIVVVAGFQGMDEQGQVTTLGRGGSDTTAAALAAAFGARACQIFTDVDSVYSADPRVVSAARPIPEMRSDEMQEMAWCGAQVLKAEAVEFAKTNRVELQVRSAFEGGDGTHVRVAEAAPGPMETAVFKPHQPAVAGVAGRKDLLRLRGSAGALPVSRLDDLFDSIAGYDLVSGRLDKTDSTFDLLLSTQEIPDPQRLYVDLDLRFGGSVSMETDLGAVSLIGFGIGSRPKALWQALQALDRAELEVRGSFTGRESLSFLVDAERVEEGVRGLHQAFIETAGPAQEADDQRIHSIA